MVIYPETWSQVLHGPATNAGVLCEDRKSLSCKLSVWELVGALLALSSAPDRVRNKQAVTFIDNIGSVVWWNKGWSKGCQLGNTVIRALYLLARSLNCSLWVEHIHRCSCSEAIVADSISKSDFQTLRREMSQADTLPRRVPLTLVNWMKNPKPNRLLGEEILAEMSRSTEILGYYKKRKTRWDK